MDLNEVTVYVKVVQAGSFNGAAKALRMPNSTVSAKVSALEKRLGVTLLHRTTRKLNVTQEGQAFFERALAGLELLKQAVEGVGPGGETPHGLLRVTAPTALGATLLPSVAARFRRKYPEVRLEFLLTDRSVDLVGEGVDLALRAGEMKDSTLVMRKLGVSNFAAFASPVYLKARPAPKHPKDLRDQECIQYVPMGRKQWSFINRAGNKVSVSLEGVLLTDDLGMARQLALNGQGIALLPSFLCSADERGGKLVNVLPDWRSESHPISFVYPQQKFVPAKVSKFIETGVEVLGARHFFVTIMR